MHNYKAGLDILLAEDDPNDVFFFKQACEKLPNLNSFHAVAHARAAIDYLEAHCVHGPDGAASLPTLVVSDLKMPGGDGFDLLRWLKNHKSCKVIPAIILSASSLEQDVQLAYELGANAYLTKPGNIDELRLLVQKTFDFWRMCQRAGSPGA